MKYEFECEGMKVYSDHGVTEGTYLFLNGDRWMETRDFSWALGQLKIGKKVSRSGWNGKDMWVVFQEAYPEGVSINLNTANATGISYGTICKFLPYLMLKTASGAFVPWVASQTDLLSDDWNLAD